MKHFYLKHKSTIDILLTYLALCAVAGLLILVWALSEGAEVFGYYLLGVLFGLFQLPLCFKPKKVAVKLIPVYLIVLLLLLAYMSYTAGGLGNEIGGLILGVLALTLSVGALVAWLTFAIVRMRERKSKKLEK